MDLLGSLGMPVHQAVPVPVYGGGAPWGPGGSDLDQWEAGDVGVRKG